MRPAAFSISFVLMLVLTGAVWAAEPDDTSEPLADLQGREAIIEDLTPRGHAALLPLNPARAELSLSFGTRHTRVVDEVTPHASRERRDYAGGVRLTLPTDFGLSASKAKTEADDQSAVDDMAVDQTEIMERAPRSDEPPTLLLLIRPRDARSAIAAASRQQKHHSAASRLDSLSSRARWSALLPTLRLRATRLIDESTSLSPTSYDANRTTSSGGASLWLEARSTWQLDRLVFADEEVGVERMRRKLHSDRVASAQHTLSLLFEWQRALQRMYDPMLHPEQCLPALLEEQRLRITLDIDTGGWLSRWLRERHVDGVVCAEQHD